MTRLCMVGEPVGRACLSSLCAEAALYGAVARGLITLVTVTKLFLTSFQAPALNCRRRRASGSVDPFRFPPSALAFSEARFSARPASPPPRPPPAWGARPRQRRNASLQGEALVTTPARCACGDATLTGSTSRPPTSCAIGSMAARRASPSCNRRRRRRAGGRRARSGATPPP